MDLSSNNNSGLLDLKFLGQNVLSDFEICQLLFAPAVCFYDSIIGILYSMSLLQ